MLVHIVVYKAFISFDMRTKKSEQQNRANTNEKRRSLWRIREDKNRKLEIHNKWYNIKCIICCCYLLAEKVAIFHPTNKVSIAISSSFKRYFLCVLFLIFHSITSRQFYVITYENQQWMCHTIYIPNKHKHKNSFFSIFFFVKIDANRTQPLT